MDLSGLSRNYKPITKCYKAWIPTVNGRLSFTSFGETGSPPHSKWTNRGDKTSRYLVAERKKTTSDVILPFKGILGRYLFNRSGTMHFLCLAKTSAHGKVDQEKLAGTLYLFHGDVLWKEKSKRLIDDLRSHLDAFEYLDRGKTLEETFDTKFGEITEEIKTHSDFYMNFSTMRNGVTSLTLDEDMTISSGSPNFPTNDLYRRHIEHVICSQLYFFLRDIGHTHQHHNANTDTIIDIQECDEEELIKWRLPILYSMYRKIIHYKRTPHQRSFYHAMGLLAYAKSFYKITQQDIDEAHRHNSTEAKRLKNDLPFFNDETLFESINAIQSERDYRDSRNTMTNQILTILLIPIVGLMMSYSALLSVVQNRPNIVPSDGLLFISKLFVETPVYVIASLLIFLTILLYIFGRIRIYQNEVVKNLNRIFHRLSIDFQSAIFLAFGTLFVFLGVSYGLLSWSW